MISPVRLSSRPSPRPALLTPCSGTGWQRQLLTQMRGSGLARESCHDPLSLRARGARCRIVVLPRVPEGGSVKTGQGAPKPVLDVLINRSRPHEAISHASSYDLPTRGVLLHLDARNSSFKTTCSARMRPSQTLPRAQTCQTLTNQAMSNQS